MFEDLAKSILRECELLLDKIFYLEKMNNDQRPTFDPPAGNFEEEKKERQMLFSYCDQVRKRKVKVKAYFTLLIFDLVHAFHLDNDLAKIAKGNSLNISIKRFKRSKEIDVVNLHELVVFFRDAIAHPEEKAGEISPRKSVKYNFDTKNTFMWGGYDESNSDVFYQIGDCKIFFKQIRKLLRTRKGL